MTIRLFAIAACLATMLWVSRNEAATELVTLRGSVSSPAVIPAWYATARTAPATPVQLSRVLAMVHAAMHDAVNGAAPRYETYASDLTDRRAHPEAAAAAAAHRVLSGLFPALQASWDSALVDSLSAVQNGRAKALGTKLGAAVGQLILETRADDGWNGVDPFTPAPAPGIWRPTPPALAPMPEPQFQNVTPFTIENRRQFLLPPPPALASVEYRLAFDEVKSLGQDSSTKRTADQTHIAHFWFEAPYDSWTRIAGILQADNGYDLHQTARLYALVTMVVADGLVSGWYWKRHHAFWRPITAIREASTDGNPHTTEDPLWQPLRATPGHPDHPSTHSVTGGAAAEVLRRFAGSDRHRFCMTTLTALPTGSTRCYDSFSKAQETMATRACLRASISGRQFARATTWVNGSGASHSRMCCDRCVVSKPATMTVTGSAIRLASEHDSASVSAEWSDVSKAEREHHDAAHHRDPTAGERSQGDHNGPR